MKVIKVDWNLYTTRIVCTLHCSASYAQVCCDKMPNLWCCFERFKIELLQTCLWTLQTTPKPQRKKKETHRCSVAVNRLSFAENTERERERKEEKNYVCQHRMVTVSCNVFSPNSKTSKVDSDGWTNWGTISCMHAAKWIDRQINQNKTLLPLHHAHHRRTTKGKRTIDRESNKRCDFRSDGRSVDFRFHFSLALWFIKIRWKTVLFDWVVNICWQKLMWWQRACSGRMMGTCLGFLLFSSRTWRQCRKKVDIVSPRLKCDRCSLLSVIAFCCLSWAFHNHLTFNKSTCKCVCVLIFSFFWFTTAHSAWRANHTEMDV